MDRATFFKLKNPAPVFFRTTRELTAPSWNWVACSAPDDEQIHTIPVGSVMTINCYSAQPEGHSMSLVEPRRVYKGMPRANNRFFYCPYDAMERVDY